MNTLQAYLQACLDRGVEDHTLHVWKDAKGHVGFTLHGEDGKEDPAYWVTNNTLIPACSPEDDRVLPYVEAVIAWVRGGI